MFDALFYVTKPPMKSIDLASKILEDRKIDHDDDRAILSEALVNAYTIIFNFTIQNRLTDRHSADNMTQAKIWIEENS